MKTEKEQVTNKGNELLNKQQGNVFDFESAILELLPTGYTEEQHAFALEVFEYINEQLFYKNI